MPTEGARGRQRRFEPTQGLSRLHCREIIELAVEKSGDTVERTVVARARKANTFRTNVSCMFLTVLYRAACASSFIGVVVTNSLEPHQLPDWLQHMLGHMFVHQDMVFLHHQASLASRGVLSSRAYRCPRRPRPPPLAPPHKHAPFGGARFCMHVGFSRARRISSFAASDLDVRMFTVRNVSRSVSLAHHFHVIELRRVLSTSWFLHITPHPQENI